MPFKLGMPELIIILVIILLLFGAAKIPQIGNSLGKGIKEFRRAVSGPTEEEKKKRSRARSKKA